MEKEMSKFPKLQVNDGLLFLDSNQIRAVTGYKINRPCNQPDLQCCELELTVLIDPDLVINELR